MFYYTKNEFLFNSDASHNYFNYYLCITNGLYQKFFIVRYCE